MGLSKAGEKSVDKDTGNHQAHQLDTQRINPLWNAFLHDSGLNITIIDERGTLLYCTRAVTELFGVKPSAIEGRSMTEAMLGPTGEERLTIIKRALESAKPLLVEEVFAGLPTRTIIRAVPAFSGPGRCILCIHHIGAAAATITPDPTRYEIVHPVHPQITELSNLTTREREVLRLIGEGLSQDQIAQRLHRSLKTIEWHRTALARKTGATSRVELAHIAIRHGLVRLDAIHPPAKPDADAKAKG